MKDFFKTAMAMLAMAAFTLSGCADPSDTEQFSEVAEHDNEQSDQDPHAGHAHPTHGPHGGDLIELGNEEYHAELVHPQGHDDDAHHDDVPEGSHDKDDAHDHAAHDHAGITIYVLDGAAKNAVAIEAAEITLNLTHDGKPEQFTLAASPDANDPEGRSSRFTSADKDLLEHFHEAEHVEGALVLSIKAKSYRGKLSHKHDGDHGHPHEEHGSDHHHVGGDALVWRGETREHMGLQIQLGHHGKSPQAGQMLEPAVSISRDGKPVPNLKVFNSLMSADGKTVLAEEVATVFEPTTKSEPAHYAQGALAIPKDVDGVIIKYRISTSDAVDVTFNLPIAFE